MISLMKVSGNKLQPVMRTSLLSERQLQDWIANDPKIIGLDVMIIGTEVKTAFGSRIDILAMDNEGDLCVIELKKDRTPRDIVAQVLDYASWVSSLNTKQVHDLVHELLGRIGTCFRETSFESRGYYVVTFRKIYFYYFI